MGFILHADSLRNFQVKPFDPLAFFCELPLVEDIRAARSLIHCGIMCMNTDRCLLIKYSQAGGQNSCGLLLFDMVNGTWDSQGDFDEWYITDFK